MEILFENIVKIQYFNSINKDGVDQKVMGDEQTNEEDIGEQDTTMLIHLKKPAHFYVLKHKHGDDDKPSAKLCMSPFALPQADSSNQYLNYWNMN